jgi:uncharacterized protein (DUF4415 family)
MSALNDSEKNSVMDAEMLQFGADVRESLRQAARGDYGRVTTPEQMVARRGRPVGSLKAQPKASTTIRFDHDVLTALKATGKGWQTRVNEAMRAYVSTWQTPSQSMGAHLA